MPKRKKPGRAPNANPAQLREARNMGIDTIMVFSLTVLFDKFGFSREDAVRFIRETAALGDGVRKGYVDYADLHRVLVEEQGLEW